MMLSDQDIREAIKSGLLTIDPMRDEFIRASGVTLHLGRTLLKPVSDTVIDVKKGTLPDYQEIKLDTETAYTLNPGEFLLGHTHQKVTVGNSLGFLIEGRSTLARIGLTIVQTAMIVYPGHTDRAVTLELANHGPNPIKLYYRMKIARAAIFELKTPSTIMYDDYGKYKDQSGVGKPVFKDEVWED
ncbi:MAG: dCTP deaminase [Candidatus Dadabacteria bacterium]|nr:MAG: dCTP deaminase [Candidatus Dadabacteria bacterium]